MHRSLDTPKTPDNPARERLYSILLAITATLAVPVVNVYEVWIVGEGHCNPYPPLSEGSPLDRFCSLSLETLGGFDTILGIVISFGPTILAFAGIVLYVLSRRLSQWGLALALAASWLVAFLLLGTQLGRF